MRSSIKRFAYHTGWKPSQHVDGCDIWPGQTFQDMDLQRSKHLKFMKGKCLLYRPSRQQRGIAQWDATQQREYQIQGQGVVWMRSESYHWELVYATYTSKSSDWGNNTRWGRTDFEGSLPDSNIIPRRRKSKRRKRRSRQGKMLCVFKRPAVHWNNTLTWTSLYVSVAS